MDLSDVVSVRKFHEFSEEQKNELYDTLLDLAEAVEEIPKKSLRKTLAITLAVLQFKGDQATSLQEQLDTKSLDVSQDDSQNGRLIDENEKLKRMLGKSEEEKHSFKNKIKELTDEIFGLQKRLQEASNTGDVSDKDSSDPLSELDKQEELLKNINAKNKHIKRLLREIEALQTQNIEQSKTIIDSEKQLHQAKAKVLQLSADITLVDSERKALKETTNELQIEISRLEGNVTYLEEEREKGERDLKDFIAKLEAKAQSWKQLLDEKDKELKKLRTKLESGKSDDDSCTESQTKSSEEDADGDTTKETTKMLHAIESRDKLIEQLELKIKTMAEEMLSSTKLMNRISAERKEEQNVQKPRSCCKLIEESLHAANARSIELSEMLERSEEDNALKSKQAIHAMAALEAYQRGEDGLVKALRKCSSLEQKLTSRDKQIQALVMELNSLHEIAHENTLLRKRLNIPDDVVIATKNLAAKERSKDKMIDRLTLKLRASEEMRLQLKMEKADLRTQLIGLQRKQPEAVSEENVDSTRMPSEVGEVEDSSREEKKSTENLLCYSCQQELITGREASKVIQPELDVKYQEIIEENETLRMGMMEILEKLREYDECSDHITIDTEILLRLLEILQKHASTSTVTTSRLQTEMQSLKMREKALRELLRKQQQMEYLESNDLSSVESIREDGEVQIDTADLPLEIPPYIDTSTRPTTPNKTLDQSQFPVISPEETILMEEINVEQTREMQQQLSELQVYRQRYEELKLHIGSIESDMSDYCQTLLEKVTALELSVAKKSNCYDFLREDFDKAMTDSKQSELKHIAEIAELKKEIVVLIAKAKELEESSGGLSRGAQYTADEYNTLQRANVEMQTQIAFMVEHILAGKAPDLTITDICTDYGIIRENLQLDYLTAEEYDKLRAEVQSTTDEKASLQRKCTQLEGLLEIAQGQILSQQKLLNEITDNHINLRHLVADLQSEAGDKLVLAKIQRDLDSAKSEVNNLKMERDQLQQKCNGLEISLRSKETHTAQIHVDFQTESRLKDTKLKFLQKSIFALKEKYAKFTPLIFLTNFVFAYAKFTKRMTENGAATNGVLSESIKQNVNDLIAKCHEDFAKDRDESQTLIKLIKAETQNKLLEEQLGSLQRKYNTVQQEITEQRMKCATEAEHWRTIEALFGLDENKLAMIEDSDDATRIINVGTRMIDVATNTDTPVPAERKLSVGSVRRKSLIEMADKNMSPIGSPLKKTDKKMVTESSTQTATGHSIEETSRADDEEECLDKNDIVVDDESNKKPKLDAIVQTSFDKHRESSGVQTLVEETDDRNNSTSEDLLKLEEQLLSTKAQLDERNDDLKKITAKLSDANAKIEELQKLVDSSSTENKESTKEQVPTLQADLNQQAGIIEKTIISFHTLLSEKDKSISKYQDLLQSEREQTQTLTSRLNQDIEDLKSTVNNLNYSIKSKDMEIMELKTKLESVSMRRNSKEKLDIATGGGEDSGDNSLNELSDEKIEEMFEQDAKQVDGSMGQVPLIVITEDSEKEEKEPDTELLKEIPALLKQIKELTDKASYWENTLKVKEEEIVLWKEKIQHYQVREKALQQTSNPEMEQLRLLLEEKDKHINELMTTLNNFHDDQQQYIDDSTNSSADQITKLAGDLTRTEATNKIYQTQVEALRRQLTNLTQREKQARELNQSLRSQLIKRPVVSIKTELNARVKNENLQKRIHQLELELEEARVQIQRQHIVIEAKRAKSASEVGLWEKQKRWQQNAEKFKAKLEETECSLEKTRSLLQTARNAITRLEKDKQILEAKLGRATHGTSYNVKCCRTPSCPNLHPSGVSKYSTSESPETYTGGSSECSSPAQGASGGRDHQHDTRHYFGSNESHHGDLIEALKARIEMQQRKILAMELEGKGSNALTTELEKLQEKFSACEAHNIRLEAKNLQLQLDNDLLRQGDVSDRLQKRIKHLEDYIIALKEEMAQTEARRELCKCATVKVNTQSGQAAEQTILSLRNIVEKLRAENKYLKDGRRSTDSRSSVETPTDMSRLQRMYTESIEKISSLQAELNMKSKCTTCVSRGKAETHSLNDELKYIKDQLTKKTQLLQKAKVLLTRAAAKEKVLKEQLGLWKRKCSELQNVPVIDEISE